MGYKDFNKPRKNAWCQNTGYYPLKNPDKYINSDKRVIYRSKMELKFCANCDENPKIIRWASEEEFMAIQYIHPLKQKISKYYPDYYVEVQTKDGIKKYMVEVKPRDMLKKPPPLHPNATRKQIINRNKKLANIATNLAKNRAASEWCKKRGIQYIFLTETFFNM